MTPTQEMTKVLFDKETISKVKDQFKSGKEKVPIDCKDMNFRLLKTSFGNINLELLCRDESGMFFKAIGYYNSSGGGIFSSGKLSITILKEFENDYKDLVKTNSLNSRGIEVLFMKIKDSALIATFSRETYENIKIMYDQKAKGVSKEMADVIGPFPHIQAMQFDKSIKSNGLKIDLLFSFEGYPQVFLDDEYGIKGGFGVYVLENNRIGLHPMTEYQTEFEKFHKMGLLSAFNAI